MCIRCSCSCLCLTHIHIRDKWDPGKPASTKVTAEKARISKCLMLTNETETNGFLETFACYDPSEQPHFLLYYF